MSNGAILLVDDSPDDVDLTIRALREANVSNEIIVARDGVEALDYLFGTGPYAGRDASDLPAVTLLDLRMPRVEGLEVLDRIRTDERTKLAPVVILTTSDEESDRLAGYELGANSYIRKPVGFDQFNEAIRQLGLYWLLLNVPPIQEG